MNNLKMILISVVGVIAVIIMLLFIVNGAQNKAIDYEEQINTAKSDIKVQEKRRVDLIGNLVDCVKEYDEHEYSTLKDVVDARTSDTSNDQDIQNVTAMITATAEAYPELKSSDNYKQLMTELSVTENMIAEYRSNYNKQVKQYNRYVRKFPNKQFLSILGYEAIECDYLDYDVSDDAPTKLFED